MPSSYIYLGVVLAVLIGEYLLDLAVAALNLRRAGGELPGEFEGWYDPERYRRSQAYLAETTRLTLVEETARIVLLVFCILLGGFDLADQFARGFGAGPIGTGLVFAGTLLFASQLLTVPCAVWRIFSIEERYGFNRTTPATFVKDLLKKWLLGGLIGGAALAAVLWLFEREGARAWALCWAVVVLLQLCVVFVAPALILPLFNTFIPLEDGELKEAIHRTAKALGFRMRGVWRMDASRRSTRSNAFFTGLGRFRKIVLFDTLIATQTVGELTAILAHEIGHYKKCHLFIAFLASAASTGVMFFLLSLLMESRGLFDAFRMTRISAYAGIALFGFLYAPVQAFLSTLLNGLSRRNEYAADAFAAGAAGAVPMISALKKLSVDNLSNLTPHPLKVILDYSHPPVLERIRALRRLPSEAGARDGRPQRPILQLRDNSVTTPPGERGILSS